MIAGRYTQGGKLQIVDVPIPTIGDDELLLRVEASAICGSDVKIIHQGHHKLHDGQTLVLGHEFVGTIAQVGARLAGFTVGAREVVTRDGRACGPTATASAIPKISISMNG